MSAIDDIRNYLIFGAIAATSAFAEMDAHDQPTADPTPQKMEQMAPRQTGYEEVMEIVPDTPSTAQEVPADELRSMPKDPTEPPSYIRINNSDGQDTTNVWKSVDTGQKNGILWQTGHISEDGTIKKDPYSTDYPFDMDVVLLNNNNLVRTSLHQGTEKLPVDYAWANEPFQELGRQWDKIINDPEACILADAFRQRGNILVLSSGEADVHKLINAVAKSSLQTTEDKDGTTTGMHAFPGYIKNTTENASGQPLDENNISGIISISEQIYPYGFSRTTLIHEMTHAMDVVPGDEKTNALPPLFSASMAFRAAYVKDYANGEDNDILHFCTAEMHSLISDKIYAQEDLFVEMLARLNEKRHDNPETFKQQCPTLDAFYSQVFYPSLKTQLVANQIGDKSAQEAKEKSLNLPNIGNFQEWLSSLLEIGKRLEKAHHRHNQEEIAAVQKEMDEYMAPMEEKMKSFGEDMGKTSRQLVERHKEYSNDLNTKGVTGQDIVDLKDNLQGQKTAQEYIAILDKAPDLTPVKEPSVHFRADVLSLSGGDKNEGWQEFSRQAWESDKDSPLIQTMKGLADKNYPQAQLFMGQYMMDKLHDPETAEQYLTMAKNNPIKIGKNYEQSVQVALDKLNQPDNNLPPMIYSVLQRASELGNQQLAQANAAMTVSVAQEPKGGAPLLETKSQSAKTTFKTAPTPKVSSSGMNY